MTENQIARPRGFRVAERLRDFSIGFSQIESVREYIARQEEHHRKVSFQDEFRQLLRRYEIEFGTICVGLIQPYQG